MPTDWVSAVVAVVGLWHENYSSIKKEFVNMDTFCVTPEWVSMHTRVLHDASHVICRVGFLVENSNRVSYTLERFKQDPTQISDLSLVDAIFLFLASIRRTTGLMAAPTLHQPTRPLSTIPTLHLPPVSAYRTKIPCGRAVLQWLCSSSVVCEWWLREQSVHDAGRWHLRRVGFQEGVTVEEGVDGKESDSTADRGWWVWRSGRERARFGGGIGRDWEVY
jgi:hypothetical protein